MTALRLEPEVTARGVRLIAVTQAETDSHGGPHGAFFSAVKQPVALIICDIRGKRFVALEESVDIGEVRALAEQIPI